jgi:16S rRNA (guanine966-N2)-methyltransferase
MRVVAGSARGRRLAPVPAGTRPVMDRAREGLFSSLGPSVEGAAVLDLYAGTGALGIEALSRGAASATFVESSGPSVRTIRDNLDRTGLSGRAEVRRGDVLRFLDHPGKRYDLILADPPYDAGPEAVDALVTGMIEHAAAPGATVALTRPAKGYTPVVPVNWHVARRLRYGDTLILLYREV